MSLQALIVPMPVFTAVANIKFADENPGGINFPQIYTYPYNNTSIAITLDVLNETDYRKTLNVWWVAIGG